VVSHFFLSKAICLLASSASLRALLDSAYSIVMISAFFSIIIDKAI